MRKKSDLEKGSLKLEVQVSVRSDMYDVRCRHFEVGDTLSMTVIPYKCQLWSGTHQIKKTASKTEAVLAVFFT